VTAGEAVAGGGDRSQELYEEIRHLAVTGSTLGGQHGLVVLLREGLAAWWVRRSICSDPVEPGSEPDRHVEATLVSDQIQAGMVRVLASMALGSHYKNHHQEISA
jgi:hypothetical protein